MAFLRQKTRRRDAGAPRMNTPQIECPSCKASLPGGVFNISGMAPCPNCRTRLQIEVFPALFRPAAIGRPAESVMLEGESSCFYHPQKKAVLPCDACGRFVCALCDCEVGGQHFCPTCLEAGRTKRKIKNLEKRRTRYDDIALSLTILPALCFYPSLIAAPIAIYLAIRHWNTPLSIVPRSKIRYVLALILATVEIAGWVVFFYFVANHRNIHG